MPGSVVGLFAAPKGGVPKPMVHQLEITTEGCIGDFQRDKKHHGGPEKAVCLFSTEVISQLQTAGHPIFPGSVGENVLVNEIDWNLVGVGTQFHFQEVVLEITSDAPPCKTIQESFNDGEFKSISVKVAPHLSRWYARVIKEGCVRMNEFVEIN